MDDMFGDAAERLFAATFTPALQRAAVAGDRSRDGAGRSDDDRESKANGITVADNDGDSAHHDAAIEAALDAAWLACENAGFADALLPEAAGGSGLTLDALFTTALAAGRHALPVPLIHTALIAPALHAAGIMRPAGSIALAPFAQRDGTHLHVRALPWGKTARWVVAQCADDTRLLDVSEAVMTADSAYGSLQADLRWPQTAGIAVAIDNVATLAATAYTGQIAGAMQRVLEMTVGYAEDRKQFGKSIGKFQAIQQQLSVMAEHVAAARIGAQMAFQSTTAQPDPLLAAVGKRAASAGAPVIAATAHAVHGAIGITAEYDLHRYTRLLHQWRHAAGSESYWDARIGRAALASSDRALDFMRLKLNPHPASHRADALPTR
ncbi:acyl-CoA dehydrogenase family protein [Alcaligenaceae bacterium B3P038]|nr:acyl-CoA dehydrogenase family protein [Alcaligenaceae bacterium B3P038]